MWHTNAAVSRRPSERCRVWPSAYRKRWRVLRPARPPAFRFFCSPLVHGSHEEPLLRELKAPGYPGGISILNVRSVHVEFFMMSAQRGGELRHRGESS